MPSKVRHIVAAGGVGGESSWTPFAAISPSGTMTPDPVYVAPIPAGYDGGGSAIDATPAIIQNLLSVWAVNIQDISVSGPPGTTTLTGNIELYLIRGTAVVGGGRFALIASGTVLLAGSSTRFTWDVSNTALVSPIFNTLPTTTKAMLPLEPGDVIVGHGASAAGFVGLYGVDAQ